VDAGLAAKPTPPLFTNELSDEYEAAQDRGEVSKRPVPGHLVEKQDRAANAAPSLETSNEINRADDEPAHPPAACE
jgi:hypothetical protein